MAIFSLDRENKESCIYLLFSLPHIQHFAKKKSNTTETLNTFAYLFPKQHLCILFTLRPYLIPKHTEQNLSMNRENLYKILESRNVSLHIQRQQAHLNGL